MRVKELNMKCNLLKEKVIELKEENEFLKKSLPDIENHHTIAILEEARSPSIPETE